jgi:hypothetical protein
LTASWLHQNRLLSIHEIGKRDTRERCVVGGDLQPFPIFTHLRRNWKEKAATFYFSTFILIVNKKIFICYLYFIPNLFFYYFKDIHVFYKIIAFRSLLVCWSIKLKKKKNHTFLFFISFISNNTSFLLYLYIFQSSLIYEEIEKRELLLFTFPLLSLLSIKKYLFVICVSFLIFFFTLRTFMSFTK